MTLYTVQHNPKNTINKILPKRTFS